MKITNNTDWDTRDLRMLFDACCKMAPVEVRRKNLRVIIGNSRTLITGESFININSIWMKIPANIESKDLTKFVRLAAWVFIHELHHCAGYGHDALQNTTWHPCYLEQKDPKVNCVSWADNYKIRKKVPREEYYQQRLEEAKKMVSRHTKRGEKESKLTTNWERKVRYYSRRVEQPR